ncbi:putative methyltransferase [Cafeteria roenbergensis virus]|uniref:Putative methyltransferase n=1 Tax=Cafeteria roenbergensis virus (strain BV-PW1) TaxID=693272 RepID=E3T5P3_CROVB|nr:putative methyltransferase [Cafeteria roenbergensis virus BV-PW1]ADO67506.1 putative methyltransferase [Cafeteria roenbergensis virus BV-PW1]
MQPKTFIDLYQDLINLDNFKEYLTQKWKGTDVLESVFRLFSYLELFEQFKGYSLCQGNFNNYTLKPIKNIIKERKNIMSKSLKDKGDKSDLTFIKDNKLIITSCKNFKKYNIGKLDIRDLQAIFTDKYTDYTYRLCLVIRNKQEILQMVFNAEECNKDLKDIIVNKNTILIDYDDITQAYYKFIKLYPSNVEELFKYQKPLLNLKFHQELAIIKSMELIKTYDDILWGHIPRSGKSYIMAGMILQSKANNLLVITTSPNETINQYLKMFNTYQQFDNFNIVWLNGKNKKPTLTDKNIIICSKQFLQSKDKTKKIKWLEELVFDMRFIDESHNGGTTELAQNTLNLYGNNKITKTFYITATYLKPTNNYQIPKEAWVLWDLEDVVLCKNILSSKNQKILIKKYGNNVHHLLKEYNLINIQQDYSKYPKLEILTWKFNQEVSDIIKKECSSTSDEGFSIESILLLKNEVEDKKVKVIPKFQNEDKVKELSWNIFGKKVKKGKVFLEDKTYKDNFLNRIKLHINSVSTDSRWFNKKKPLSILCFLPVGIENMPIDVLSEAYQTLLEQEKIIPDFNIVTINSKNNNGGNPKDIVDDAYQKTINDKKSGLLILSGKQLSLGVSIPHCDIVILMNNITSMDMIYQMMFRCMTEDDNKQSGFVIDLNLDRSINMIADYSTKIYNSSSDIKKGIKKILSQNLIGFNTDEWNKDIFGIQYNNLDEFINDIYKTYVSHPSKALDKILKLLNFKSDIFTKDENILIKKLFTIDNSNKSNKLILDAIKDLTKPDVSKGIDVKLSDSPTDSEKDKKDKKEKDINIMTDIMKHLIPLLSLLTIHNDKSSFEEQINLIESNNILKNILLEQIHTWWGNKFNHDILNVFLVLYQKRLKDNKEFNMVCSRTKEMFYQNISNSKELSKLIDKYLIPQELEKKTNAEVSTPYQLRQEMLDKIPLDFWSKKRKVFEPCSGKGGFLMDIVDKFMIGLKDKYPDDKKRYKIIVEKCLYFSDINPTNIFLNKLLLDPYGDYKLNYNEGNTLELDIKEKWGLEGFDAVIGNPPYQAPSLNKKSSKILWNKFVNKSINYFLQINGYLLYIHPALWRKPNHTLLKLILENQLIYLKIYNDTDGKKLFGCTTRADYYLLQKCKNKNKTLICFEDNETIKTQLNEKINFIPNYGYHIFNKLKKKLKHGIDTNISSKLGTSNKNVNIKQTKLHIYPLFNSNSNKNGLNIRYSKVKHENQNKKKVIFSNGRYIYPIYDNGVYGTTQGGIYIYVKTKEEGLNLVNFLNSNLIKFIIKSTKWSNFEICKDIFNYIEYPLIEVYNNNTINKFFELSNEEINYINSKI